MLCTVRAPRYKILVRLTKTYTNSQNTAMIVATNGPQAFQTFRLLGGATKIGTGAPSQIVVNDGFMSIEHCQIVSSPQGFVLQDGGSTNGTLVNGKRISTHELVDNDAFTLGKTNFKFKSIN